MKRSDKKGKGRECGVKVGKERHGETEAETETRRK